MKFEKICRTCLIEKESLQPIFNVVEMLKECTSIQVDIGDGLPELICFECVNKLNNSFEFRKQCKTSEETLRDYMVKSNTCFNKNNLTSHDNYEEINFDIKLESSCNIIEPEFNDNTNYNTCVIKKNEETDILEVNGGESNQIVNDSDDESLFQRKMKQSTNYLKEEGKNIVSVQQNEKNKCKSVFEKHNKRTKSFMKQVNNQTIGKRKSKLKDGLPCPKCSQCFELESDLEIHMISHPKTDEIICTKCSKTFSNLAYLRKHVTTHLINKPYKCLYCSKSFANAGGRLAHLRTHTGEKPYVCSTCGKRFSDSSGLSAHMKSHSDVKNFACTFCPKFFKFPNDLRNHLRIHTGEKPFLCTVCGESFAQAYCVTKHMRKHTGERPYSCTECGRKFRLNHQLKFHMRTHTGEKPHVCKICDMGFARPESLVRHNRSHTGEMPYICDICFKSYPVSSSLTRHKRTHTNAKVSQISNDVIIKNMLDQTEVQDIVEQTQTNTPLPP